MAFQESAQSFAALLKNFRDSSVHISCVANTLYTTNILHFPPRGILKIGGGNFNTFSKVDQAVPNWASSAKKKNVPNWAKIIGECFAEFLFYGPSRPGGPLTGLIRAWPKSTLGQHWRSWAFPEHPLMLAQCAFGSGPDQARQRPTGPWRPVK